MLTLLWVLLLAMLRKGVHRYFAIALIAPVALSIALPTILRSTDVLSVLGRSTENTLVAVVTARESSFGKCYPAKLTGSAMYRGLELPLLVAVKDLLAEHALGFTVVSEGCGAISVPQHLYRTGEEVVFNNTSACPTYVHKGVEAIIVFTNTSTDSTAAICAATPLEVLEHAYTYVESTLLSKVALWITVLAVSHVPILLIAITRAVSTLHEEVTALNFIGVSRTRLLLFMGTAILILALATQFIIASITVVFLHILANLIGVPRLISQPIYSLWISIVAPVTLATATASTMVVCNRVVARG